MAEKLVYDVGMETGDDTAFYLSRGCRVVGIEANPYLFPMLKERFAAELKQGLLYIINKAVSNVSGTVQFAANRDRTQFSSMATDFIERYANQGDKLDFIEVEVVSLADILRRYGIPYYLKIDVEGMDMACVETLHSFNERPQYLSLESCVTSGIAEFEKAFSELAHLWVLGYRHFKYVDQAALGELGGRLLQAEGTSIHYKHRHGNSGPFGEEAPGTWLDIEHTLHAMRRHIGYQNTLGFGGKRSKRFLSKIGNRLRRYSKGLPSHSWYDLHARM
jgi:FkbM family methyltransferase